jgi:hypothetical protein
MIAMRLGIAMGLLRLHKYRVVAISKRRKL